MSENCPQSWKRTYLQPLLSPSDIFHAWKKKKAQGHSSCLLSVPVAIAACWTLFPSINKANSHMHCYQFTPTNPPHHLSPVSAPPYTEHKYLPAGFSDSFFRGEG